MRQKKNVFAYRMICKDTVEEKIIQWQESKKKVSRDLIGEGDSILASLDKERLLALFQRRNRRRISLSWACGRQRRAVSRARPSTAPFVYSLGFC